MANRSISHAAKAERPASLDLSTIPPLYPESVGDKITSARGIVLSTMATLDAEQTENFDPHWTLSVAIALLEQASAQLDSESMKEGAA